MSDEHDREDGKQPETSREPPAWLDKDPFSGRTEQDEPRAVTAPPARSGSIETAQAPSARAEAPSRAAEAPARAAEAPAPAAQASARPARRTDRVAPVEPPARKESGAKAGAGSLPSRPVADGAGASRDGGVPLWAWPLLLLVVVAVVFVVFDIRNRDRYRLFCDEGTVEVQRARRLLWPFGYVAVGGQFRPVAVTPEVSCPTQVMQGSVSAEAAFVDLLLEDARRGLKSDNAQELERVRRQAEHALGIARLEQHRLRRSDALNLLADVDYRLGRIGIDRVEREVRAALEHLRAAQKRAPDRHEDLDDWLTLLEGLLRTVAPAPGTVPVAAPTPFGTPAPTPSGPSAPAPTSYPPGPAGVPSSPVAPAPAPDEGATDAGLGQPPAPSGTAGGILM